MKNILFYLLQTIIASGMLYGYYHFFLRNKKFHRYNRFFLLAAVIISIVVPFLNIPVYFSKESTDSSVLLQTLSVICYSGGEETTANVLSESTNQIASWFSWQNIIYVIYILIALIFIIRIYLSVRKIRIISSNYPQEKIGDINFVNTSEPGTPFSFFRWLFWNNDIELNSDKGQQIFRHELFHINQQHTLDTVFMEFITAFAWFNPVFHLIKKEIKTIHEFLADEYAMSKSGDWQYAELLLMQALNTKLSLVNPFFHTQIKRRIAMITTSQKPGHQYLRKLLVLPVAAVIAVLFAFSYKNKKEENSDSIIKSNLRITIVVDAAHGGIDPGAKSPDGKYTEAQIALEVSKRIRDLAEEYNINAIMTREDDELPGNAKNKTDGLKKRIAIANQYKPDAYISVHLNSHGEYGKFQEKESGIEAFITDDKSDEKNILFAKTILNELKSVYKTDPRVKQREGKGIYVLDENTFPAVLVEFGYINNKKDLDFITDKENEEKIARAILNSISKFANRKNIPLPGEKIFPDTPKKKFPDTLIWMKDKTVVSGNIKIDTKQGGIKPEEPLLIVKDGKILGKIKLKEFDQKFDTDNIEKIEVWKNESAVSEYGEDAKNGVIVIYTKKPGQDSSIKKPSGVLYHGTDMDNVVFEKVEVEPSFPGGSKAWQSFLTKNLNPNIAKEKGAKAGLYKVVVRFIVDRYGTVSSINALSKNGYGMEEEAIRVISNSPKWIPAIQKGITVKAYKTQPVFFAINPEEIKKKIITYEPKKENTLPAITKAQLLKSKPDYLLRLNLHDIVSFKYSTDSEDGTIYESVNIGSEFTESTKKLIQNAEPGNTIIIEEIFVMINGQKKKAPAQVYYVTN